MSVNPLVAKNFSLDTDYPLDKIIYMKTGSFTIGAHTIADTNIIHGLPFIPLLDGTWSTDASFALSYDMGSGTPSTNSALLFDIVLSISADSTNAIVNAQNGTGSSVTVYYRIFGLEPSNSNLEAPFTSNEADNFVLNMDHNYTKLYQAGFTPISTVISHNLGYRTQTNMWEELSGVIRKVNDNGINGPLAFYGNFSTSVSTTDVTITFDPFAIAGVKAHYRIYLDN